MMNIIFLRHAETEYNKNNQSQAGDIDPHINDNGKRQSLTTAEYLAKNYNISKIYSSKMTRAKNTAEIIKEKINCLKDIIYECKLKESSKKILEEENLTKEESKKALGSRTRIVFDNIVKNNESNTDILVVSHGSIIKNLIKNIFDIEEVSTNVITEVGNCTLTIFNIDNREIKLIKSYDNSHLISN